MVTMAGNAMPAITNGSGPLALAKVISLALWLEILVLSWSNFDVVSDSTMGCDELSGSVLGSNFDESGKEGFCIFIFH